MEQLIPIINKLQYVFRATNTQSITLPQLVVVGAQSAGKSSVLETFVGHDFLPRGSGIVTRRPLILQLVHIHNSEPNDITTSQHHNSTVPQSPPPVPKRAKDGTLTRTQSLDTNNNNSHPIIEYGEFSHISNKRFYDFNEIKDEITADTERIAGSNKGISTVPIILTIYSTAVLDLTLVDLPGLTKVALGDQPDDIELQIRNLIISYIQSQNSIIVAVTPANQDIANSDALKLAREVDPQGIRTIGVITKLDLMDKGTDAYDILQGNVIELYHGFVGVVNRSQHDINTNKTIQESKRHERQYFATHTIYRSIANKLGTDYLCHKLSTILMQHIKNTLPELKQRLLLTINETQAELDSYGQSSDISSDNNSRLLLQIISLFYKHYIDALDGKLTSIASHTLYGGARLSWLFNDVLKQQIEQLNPFDTLTDNDIRIAIKNASGSKPALFIPEIAFELLVKKQIERLLPASLELVDLVYHELICVIQQCQSLLPQVQRFPAVKHGINTTITNMLHQRVEPTKLMITNIIDCQLSYINTAHPQFIGGGNAVAFEIEQLNKRNSIIQQHRNNMTTQSTYNTVKPMEPHSAPINQPNGMNKQHANNMNGTSSQQQSTGLFNFFLRSPVGSDTSDSLQDTRNTHIPLLQLNGSNNTNSSDINSSRDVDTVDVIKTLIRSYFDIVKISVADIVPKSIMCFLVNYSKQNMQAELVKQLYNPESIQNLLCESNEIQLQRNNCIELLEMLTHAMQIINDTAHQY